MAHNTPIIPDPVAGDDGDGRAATLGSATMRELVPVASPAQQQHLATPQWTPDDLDALRNTIAKGCNDAQFRVFVAAMNRLGLDAFARQIVPIVQGDKMTPQVTIDGFRLIAERTGHYGGQIGPFWCGEDGEWREVWTAKADPVAARVGVIRRDFAQPLYDVAHMRSYRKDSPTWRQLPIEMLAKVAEARALRRAFPQQLSGVYTDDEMIVEADPAPAPERATSRHTRAECSRYASEHGLSLAAYQRAAAKYADDDALWDALHEGVRILEEKRQAQQEQAVTVTEADPAPEPEPDEPPSETKTTKPYSMLGDVELRARADRIGYKTVDAIEMLLAKAGLTVETAMRAECEAALHAEEVRAAAVLGPTNPVGAGGKSGAKGGAR